MGKIVYLIMGPAGAGKSTFCSTLISHCLSLSPPRCLHLVNLDPAAEYSSWKRSDLSQSEQSEKPYYTPSVDIQELVDLESVMEQLQLGPNGGLMYALEYLIDNLDWFDEKIGDFEDDGLLIDCPGQIELYTHSTIMKQIVSFLRKKGYLVCGVYLLDSQFIQDTPKFFAGVMTAMSAMLQLGIPHINVMTKMDLLGKKKYTKLIDRYLAADSSLLFNDNTCPVGMPSKFHKLNEALVRLIDEFSVVSFIPLDSTDEDSIAHVLGVLDLATQYGEDLEPKELKDHDDDHIDSDRYDVTL